MGKYWNVLIILIILCTCVFNVSKLNEINALESEYKQMEEDYQLIDKDIVNRTYDDRFYGHYFVDTELNRVYYFAKDQFFSINYKDGHMDYISNGYYYLNNNETIRLVGYMQSNDMFYKFEDGALCLIGDGKNAQWKCLESHELGEKQ